MERNRGAGAEAGNPAGHKLLIMMRCDQGGDQALSSAFYSQLTAHGVPFDLIGLSYYPFFHGAISRCGPTSTRSPPSSASRS